MAASPKLTPEQRARINVCLAAGESHTAIAAAFPVSRQQISKLNKARLASLAQEEAEAAAEREQFETLQAIAARHPVNFEPRGTQPIFVCPEHRYTHYSDHSGSEWGRLDFNDATYFSKSPPAERRALEVGRPLYMYPPGTRPPKRSAPDARKLA